MRALTENFVQVDRAGVEVELTREEPDGFGKAGDRIDANPLDDGASEALAAGTSKPSRPSAAAASTRRAPP